MGASVCLTSAHNQQVQLTQDRRELYTFLSPALCTRFLSPLDSFPISLYSSHPTHLALALIIIILGSSLSLYTNLFLSLCDIWHKQVRYAGGRRGRVADSVLNVCESLCLVCVCARTHMSGWCLAMLRFKSWR